MELAIATNTGPDAWWGQSDEVIATAVDVLDRAVKAAKRKGK